MHFFPRVTVALLLLLVVGNAKAQQLQSSPSSHGYGRVQIGTTKQYSFQLTNTGSRTLHILSKSRSGRDFSFGNFSLPVTLKPGKSALLPVSFTPSAAGKVTGTVRLRSDAQNSTLTINVWGSGSGAQGSTLNVSPTSLDFGNVNLGSSGNLSLKLAAQNGSVTISSVQSSTSEFSVPGVTLPLTIASGNNVTVSVLFTPGAAGTATSTLTLTSNATNSPTNVPLTGVGVAAGSHSTDLSWDPSASQVIGYNVYRGTTKGGPYSQINSALDSSTDYTDSLVTGGTTYFYVVTAVDSSNVESTYSNEVKVVIPSP